MVTAGDNTALSGQDAELTSAHNHIINYNGTTKQLPSRIVRKSSCMEVCQPRNEKLMFIQKGRRGRDVTWAVPHPCVVGKNQGGYLKSKGSQPHTRAPELRAPVPGK